jgi:heterodisulfide reductase subunit A
MDVGESCAAAQAAASKASSLLASGYVELDPFVAEVDRNKCRAHGECLSVCPEKAISMNGGVADDSKAEVNPALCTGCGVCVPACPENAIEVCGWTLKQYEAMVDAIAGLQGDMR